MKRPANFMAQDAYLVAQANWFSDQLQQVAIALYQPLVGPVALALYLTLWQEATPRPSMTERRPQTQLLEVLNISVDQLYDARVHLEAVGLLKTYTAIDAMGRYYAYELYAPLTADRFFLPTTCWGCCCMIASAATATLSWPSASRCNRYRGRIGKTTRTNSSTSIT
ncbi:hypothetical protein [Lacticaseibacillus nasuensis]|uniref:hypothetical protein n=1 Tax=Lacticaseibacillus nasuensis TaxID=944671 RepID=UPI0006CF287E|nr:hypothetical protein [Lacticaseibacillus nasuensis]